MGRTRGFAWLTLGLLACGLVQAQQASFESRGMAHGYFAAGSSMGENRADFLGGGGGGEVFLWRGLTLGGDASVYRDRYYTAVGTFGHAGANVAWRFGSRDRQRGWDPFVLFGAGAYFPKESRLAVHGGGGVIYWFGERFGVRFEFRAAERPYGDNIDGIVRIGIAFR